MGKLLRREWWRGGVPSSCKRNKQKGWIKIINPLVHKTFQI
jgi:hypothetical protein